MSTITPQLYNKLINLDNFYFVVCFCEDYMTILSYYTPIKISERVIELFFISGNEIIHEILIALMKQSE